MNSISDLFALLPDVEFIDTDAGKTEENIIQLYEALTNTVLYPADPVRLFLSTLAAVISQQKVQINQAGKMNLLRYARGHFLDHIGALVGSYRTEAIAAQTELQFSIDAPLNFNVSVPKGTRVTSDGSVYFATDRLATILAGTTTIQVPATCLTSGLVGNALVSGQLDRLVDPLPYITKVTNITESTGGAEREQDEPYRLRIALAPESFSVAGPILAYEYWARSTSTHITDVAVYSPEPGTVQLRILLVGGMIPAANSKEIRAVRDVLNAEKTRPLCDTVLVDPPVAVSKDYQLKWFITQNQEGYFTAIQAAMKSAVADYEAWQTGAIGRNINPDALIERCRAAGAWRVEITGLPYQALKRGEVTQFITNAARITFGGIEDSKS
ncbi:hypothetical protein AHYW_002607 [Providencia manganoxydans]|uniref:baseplate assembly protein n=1 Tax=Providencia manganoxydans TaxID=2923283 RepID=UPI003DA0E627